MAKKSSKKRLTPMLLPIFLVVFAFIAIFYIEYIYETPWESLYKVASEVLPGEDEDPSGKGEDEAVVEGKKTDQGINPDENDSVEKTDDSKKLQNSEDPEAFEDNAYDEDENSLNGNDSNADESDSGSHNRDLDDPEEKSLSVAESLGITRVTYTRYSTTDLNIRLDAHKDAKRIGVFLEGTQVHVIGELSNRWVQVDYGDGNGFVHGAYLRITKAAAEGPPTPPTPKDPPVEETKPPKSREDFATIINNPEAIDVLVNRDFKLPPTYRPPNLVEPKVFMAQGIQSRLLRSVAATSLEEMFTQAKAEDIVLYARSGYRSYSTQKILFDNYVKNHGYANASRFSAKPGHSEHQTGLVMDVTSASVNYRLTNAFADTREGRWIADNGHHYGFIIRYPQNKESVTGYVYEPWHLRYLGRDLATAVYESGFAYEEYLGY